MKKKRDGEWEMIRLAWVRESNKKKWKKNSFFIIMIVLRKIFALKSKSLNVLRLTFKHVCDANVVKTCQDFSLDKDCVFASEMLFCNTLSQIKKYLFVFLSKIIVFHLCYKIIKTWMTDKLENCHSVSHYWILITNKIMILFAEI